MLQITSYFNTLWTQPWVSDPVFGSRWVREHAITAELSNASWMHYSWMHPPFSHFLKHSQDSTDEAHPLWHPLDCRLRHEPYIALQPTICALQAKGGLCISRITISALTAQHAFLQTLSEVCRYERYFLNNISISYILKKNESFLSPHTANQKKCSARYGVTREPRQSSEIEGEKQSSNGKELRPAEQGQKVNKKPL